MVRQTAAMVLYGQENPFYEFLILEHGSMSKHPEGTYGLPAGGKEAVDTTLEDTAIRELSEETGYKIISPGLVKKLDKTWTAHLKRRDGSMNEMYMEVYYAPVLAALDESQETPEGRPLWFSLDKLVELERKGLLVKNVFDAISEVRKYL